MYFTYLPCRLAKKEKKDVNATAELDSHAITEKIVNLASNSPRDNERVTPITAPFSPLCGTENLFTTGFVVIVVHPCHTKCSNIERYSFM